MPDTKFIHEGSEDPFKEINSLGWIPRVNEQVVLDGVAYKIESIQYTVTESASIPNAANPPYISANYVKIVLSVVP